MLNIGLRLFYSKWCTDTRQYLTHAAQSKTSTGLAVWVLSFESIWNNKSFFFTINKSWGWTDLMYLYGALSDSTTGGGLGFFFRFSAFPHNFGYFASPFAAADFWDAAIYFLIDDYVRDIGSTSNVHLSFAN